MTLVQSVRWRQRACIEILFDTIVSEWILFLNRDFCDFFERQSLTCFQSFRNITRKPTERRWSAVGVLGNRNGVSASSKFRRCVVSRGVISTFSNSLSHPSLTITAKTHRLLPCLTANIQPRPAKEKCRACKKGPIQSQRGQLSKVLCALTAEMCLT